MLFPPGEADVTQGQGESVTWTRKGEGTPVARAKAWGCEGAPRGSGVIRIGCQKGMTSIVLAGYGPGPEVGLRALEGPSKVLKQGQHSYICVLERALWLPCGGWLRGDDAEQVTQ